MPFSSLPHRQPTSRTGQHPSDYTNQEGKRPQPHQHSDRGAISSDYRGNFGLTLRARSSGGRRPCVCEFCWVVFSGRTASACRSCRRNPPRATPQAWHLETVAGDRRGATAGGVRIADGVVTRYSSIRRTGTPSRTWYRVACAECGSTFTTIDARARHCGACGTGARRTSRARARKGASGNSGNAC